MYNGTICVWNTLYLFIHVTSTHHCYTFFIFYFWSYYRLCWLYLTCFYLEVKNVFYVPPQCQHFCLTWFIYSLDAVTSDPHYCSEACKWHVLVSFAERRRPHVDTHGRIRAAKRRRKRGRWSGTYSNDTHTHTHTHAHAHTESHSHRHLLARGGRQCATPSQKQ